MKTTTKTVYEAFDGKTFGTAAECKTYERSFAHLAIVGLTEDEALAIVTREDAERADLVEHLGKLIERRRLDAGEFKRRPSQPSESQVSGPDPAAPEPEDDTACRTCGVMFAGEPGQAECDGCAGEANADFRDAAGDAAHERARDRRAEGE